MTQVGAPPASEAAPKRGVRMWTLVSVVAVVALLALLVGSLLDSTSSSSKPGSHSPSANGPAAADVAPIDQQLSQLRKDLDNANTAISGTDVDAAKSREGSAP